MVAATILLPEITTLESQVAELQAQITVAQSRITALGEADTVASGALQALQEAVQKISGLAPSAVATLKAAALNLFQGGDDQNDDGGNKPISPTPSPNGNGHSHSSNAVLGQDIVLVSSSELVQHLEQQTSEIAPELNGEFSELACLLSDAPSIALTGQFVEIACPIPTVATQDAPYIELLQLSQFLAYQRLHNGEIPAAYIAFKSETRAKAWGRWLVAQNNIAAGFEVRAAKRMLGFKWEIKLWGISVENIQRLTKLDLAGIPDDQTLNAWFDSSSSRSPQSPEIEQKLNPPTIDPNDVPVGVSLRPTDDYLLREYIVWATVIARNNGVPQPTQKAIGRLVEGNEIEAYRPRSGLCRTFATTMDAVIHLIAGAGYQMADLLAAQEMQEIGLKKEPAPINAIPTETTVEVIPVPVVPEVSEPDSAPALSVGDRVEITSPRHGEQLVGQVGLVTVANPTGCVVVLGDLTHWFCSDEIVIWSDTASQVEVKAASSNPELIQVGDWVELLENNQSYEVVLKKGDNFKLLSGNETKFAPLNMVKFLFRKPADFTPF